MLRLLQLGSWLHACDACRALASRTSSATDDRVARPRRATHDATAPTPTTEVGMLDYVLMVLVVVSSVAAAVAAAGDSGGPQHECDVVIAGGSLASAAAAVAAGEASNTTTICFLEITDWPGGQVSAGGDPAPDFGVQYLNFPRNIPRSLAELLTDGEIGGPDRSPNYNPGECYLPKCFQPGWAARWFLDRLAALPNVAVFLNTTVVSVDRDAAGRVVGLLAIQRTPTTMHPSGWDRPLSQALPDWYSPTSSSYFDKAEVQFMVAPTGVVVEATEFGDVLVLADGVAVAQGMELETENSTEYDDYCGNPAAFTMYAEWGTAPVRSEDKSLAHSASARPLPDWLRIRRYWTAAEHTERSFNPYKSHQAHIPPLAPGDKYTIGALEVCDDLANANVFLPLAAAQATARAGAWVGGMNVTAIAMAEAQMMACYRNIQNNITLSVLPEDSGTSDGISKMLYLRESRRSMRGVGGFRLCHNILDASATGPGGEGCSTAADPPGRTGDGTGYRFFDTVAVGAPQPLCGFDVHAQQWCDLPRYIRDKLRHPNSTLPYFIPFRALTVTDAPNLLVAGKSMAQSFLTNSVTRLHPNEWASGTAAGVAAVIMSELNLSSAQMAANVSKLQDRLRTLGVPLAFNLT
eukprot:COSAG02_NODE_8842_length_2423_cov_1.915663_1_plen_634_part_01